jgi:hypothetical protein
MPGRIPDDLSSWENLFENARSILTAVRLTEGEQELAVKMSEQFSRTALDLFSGEIEKVAKLQKDALDSGNAAIVKTPRFLTLSTAVAMTLAIIADYGKASDDKNFPKQ